MRGYTAFKDHFWQCLGVPEIKPSLIKCKASTLFSVLLLQHPFFKHLLLVDSFCTTLIIQLSLTLPISMSQVTNELNFDIYKCKNKQIILVTKIVWVTEKAQVKLNIQVHAQHVRGPEFDSRHHKLLPGALDVVQLVPETARHKDHVSNVKPLEISLVQTAPLLWWLL